MRVTIPNDLGSLVASRRRQLDMTQKELAMIIGKDQRTISKIENDPGKVALSTIMSVLNSLNLQINVLENQCIDIKSHPITAYSDPAGEDTAGTRSSAKVKRERVVAEIRNRKRPSVKKPRITTRKV